MKCNKKQILIGEQKITKVALTPDDMDKGILETRYNQDSVCENGHTTSWSSKNPFKALKWKCSVGIYKSAGGK